MSFSLDVQEQDTKQLTDGEIKEFKINQIIAPFLDDSALQKNIANISVAKKHKFIEKWTPFLIKFGRCDIFTNYFKGDYVMGLILSPIIYCLISILMILMFSVSIEAKNIMFFAMIAFISALSVKSVILQIIRLKIKFLLMKKNNSGLLKLLYEFSLLLSSDYCKLTPSQKSSTLRSVVTRYYTSDNRLIADDYASIADDVHYNFKKNKPKDLEKDLLDDFLNNLNEEGFRQDVEKMKQKEGMKIISRVLK